MGSGDMECNRLIFRIEGSRDQIVRRCQTQPIALVEHREIFKMSIGVADQKAGKNPAQQPVSFDRDA